MQGRRAARRNWERGRWARIRSSCGASSPGWSRPAWWKLRPGAPAVFAWPGLRRRSIYRAVEDDRLFAVHENAVVKSCPVSVAIRPVLSDVFEGAESAVRRYLAGKRLSDVLDRIPRRSSRPYT
jgi:hypothetical protein